MTHFPASELILHPDGSIYHLHLHPEQLADIIITVGDQDRVSEVSKHFDQIEHRVAKREFITHTGRIGNTRLSVISTGIGTDNIDIVLNELDALVNIDLATRRIKDAPRSIDIIRIGTSGCLRPEIPVDTFLVSEMGLGMDNLMKYYPYDSQLEDSKREQLRPLREKLGIYPYLFKGNAGLIGELAPDWLRGITVTCPGFYAPQGRILRTPAASTELISLLRELVIDGSEVSNMEMETAGIYGLAEIMGHRAISFNALIANRANGKFSRQPQKTIDRLIREVLDRIVQRDQTN